MTKHESANVDGSRGANRGFTLVELFIVMVIISILAAIAVPILLRQRITANEGAAVGAMRTIVTSEAMFREQDIRDDDGNADGDYGTLSELGDPGSGQPFIDAALAGAQKAGYLFSIEVFPGDSTNTPRFSAFAFPIAYNRTGNRNFYADQEGVIRFNQGVDGQSSIGPDSPPVN